MIQRADPIPAGRYWLNFRNEVMDGGGQAQVWQTWVRKNSATVKVEVTDGANDDFAFVVFRVSSPTPRWPSAPLKDFLGFPSYAGSKVAGSADVIQSPPPEPSVIASLLEPAAPGGALDQITGAIKTIGFVAIAAYFASKILTRK